MTTPRAITWEAGTARRLTQQFLRRPAPRGQLVEVVRAVAGLQGQVLSATAWILGARVRGLTQRAVYAALWEQRTLVKTYGPRGTLAVLPADELPLWMAAQVAWSRRRASHWYAEAGLTPAQADDLLAAFEAALDGQCLTRAALAEAVAARAGAWANDKLRSTWGELLPPAAFTGRLCFGPPQGSQVTFVRADQWLGGWQALDPETALRALALRFVAAYGPVTPADFAHWLWLKPEEGQAVFAALGAELAEVVWEGKPAYVPAAERSRRWAAAPAPARLVPQYDGYVFAAGPRERVVPRAMYDLLRRRGRPHYEGATGLPVLLIDGVAAGVWQREEKAGRSTVQVQPVSALTADQRAEVAAEAERLSAFWEQPVTLKVEA